MDSVGFFFGHMGSLKSFLVFVFVVLTAFGSAIYAQSILFFFYILSLEVTLWAPSSCISFFLVTTFPLKKGL